MMFTYASRQGSIIKVNSTWQRGFVPDRQLGNEEKFMTTVVGWIGDGKTVHEQIVHQPALATLNTSEQSLDAFVDQKDGNRYGARIEASKERDLAIAGNFVGKDGYAKFQIWGDMEFENGELVNAFELPEILAIKGPANGKFGNNNLVAWRKFKFKGEFKSPSGTEKHTGVGYFQRVLMNVPMQPWKWLYAVFEDGSIFSSFMLYFGIHNFRRDFYFYKQYFERKVFHVVPGAYLYDAKTHKTIKFNKATIVPKLNEEGHPDFYIKVSNKEGDELMMRTKTHNHAQFLLDRRLFKKLWQTKYIYNEYMYVMDRMQGTINGAKFDKNTHGELWGNIEYTWGWSL